eukprot:5707320-Amphidinium_carterae.1
MESARTSMIAAFADRDGGDSRVIQSDAPQAYLQASFLHKGCTPTWISMPRSWIPDWALRKGGSPCFKLHKALYGHPQAGNLWGGKLAQSVAKKGLMSITEQPSTFFLPERKAFASVDSVRARSSKSHCSVSYKMRVRRKFKPSKCPNVTLPSGKALGKMLESERSYKRNALSHLKKVMYGARMAAPHLVLSINRLCSQVTRWTKADDHTLSQFFRHIAGLGCKDMLVGEVSRDARNHNDMHVHGKNLEYKLHCIENNLAASVKLSATEHPTL